MRVVRLLGIVAVAVAACLSDEMDVAAVKRGHEFALNLERQATTPGVAVRFRELTPFAWDRVFVFAPYTSHHEVERHLGFRWLDVPWTRIT